MSPAFLYFIETVLNGLMAGVMYSLVALGFVLIFKASGIFNFAQGVMALFAALTLVGLQTGQVPFSHLINSVFGTDIHEWGPGPQAERLPQLSQRQMAYRRQSARRRL